MEIHLTYDGLLEDLLYGAEFSETRIKKIVNRRGQIRKVKTAGRANKKVVNGRIVVISGVERRNRRLGMLKKRRTLRAKSAALKRRSYLFSKMGRKKRRMMNVKDTRRG